MDPSLSCPGCGKTFSRPKYQKSHLSQTANPACITIQNTAFTSEGKLPPHPASQSTSNIPAHTALLLNGHNSNAAENLSTSPGPSHNNTGDIDGGDNGLGDTGSDGESEDLDADSEDYGHPPTLSEFVPLPEVPEVEPVRVPFPGQRAGEVLLEGIPTMMEHENNLGGPTPNPYFPFNSEINWELAKWARLRGPSATSFTELLQINGVCLTPSLSPKFPSLMSPSSTNS